MALIYESLSRRSFFIIICSELEGTSHNDVSVADDVVSQIHERKKKKVLSKSRSTMSDDDQIEYKAGWVVRKYLFDRDGKRSKSIKH